MPLVSRTRATLRSAEFGFLGTWVHTPRFWGDPLATAFRRCFIVFKLNCSAGALDLPFFAVRPLRTSWLIVGTLCLQMEPGLAPRPLSNVGGHPSYTMASAATPFVFGSGRELEHPCPSVQCGQMSIIPPDAGTVKISCQTRCAVPARTRTPCPAIPSRAAPGAP